MAAFAIAWRRANRRRAEVESELARQKAWRADASDMLLIEQQTVGELRGTLAATRRDLAAKEFELKSAQEKIASLNGENDALYRERQRAQAELRTSHIELHYWRHFAKRVVHNARYHLSHIEAPLKESLRERNGVLFATALEALESANEYLDLAEVADVPARIRELRADGVRPAIHLMPRLHRYLQEWEETLGSRLITRAGVPDKPLLFTGAWAHLELALTTMLANAMKHSVESAPIEFEFSTAERRAHFQVTNWSATPIADGIVRGRDEMVMGDPQNPRFGLFLLDQLAAGYRALCRIENVGPPPTAAAIWCERASPYYYADRP